MHRVERFARCGTIFVAITVVQIYWTYVVYCLIWWRHHRQLINVPESSLFDEWQQAESSCMSAIWAFEISAWLFWFDSNTPKRLSIFSMQEDSCVIFVKSSFNTGGLVLLLVEPLLTSCSRMSFERDFFERCRDFERELEASGLRDLDIFDEPIVNLVKRYKIHHPK